jgi:hypothetical protein
MTQMLDHPAPSEAEPRATREDAMKFMARGHTAAGLLARAACPQTVRYLCDRAGETPRGARNLIFALSAALGRLEAEGMTPAKCWDELGWDLEFVEEVIALAATAPVPASRASAGAAPAAPGGR